VAIIDPWGPGIRPTGIILLRGPRVSIDEQHVALPKLYGAPAYARPAPTVAISPRPFDPDDLPIESLQTDDERELASSLPAYTWAPGGAGLPSGSDGAVSDSPSRAHLRPRPLSLKSIAGRLLRGD
jgi:hypothetical protein